MLTHKDGALLKELIEIDHNFTLTSNSDYTRMSITNIATDSAYGDHGDPSPGVEDVVPDNVISGGPPYLMDLSMGAPKKKSLTKTEEDEKYFAKK